MSFMHPVRRLIPIAGSILLIALACGCNRKDEIAKSPATPISAVLPVGLIVSAPAADAREIIDVRKDAKDGDEVTLKGRIGGKETPFIIDTAMVSLTDSTLKFCSEDGHMKACPTPWDMCCTDPDEVAANSITLRVVGPDGQPVKGTLNGAGGMKPMSELVVTGVVRRPSPGTAVFIDATKICVKG